MGHSQVNPGRGDEAVHSGIGPKADQAGRIALVAVDDGDCRVQFRLDRRDPTHRQGARNLVSSHWREESDLSVLMLDIDELSLQEDLNRVNHAPRHQDQGGGDGDSNDGRDRAPGAATQPTQCAAPTDRKPSQRRNQPFGQTPVAHRDGDFAAHGLGGRNRGGASGREPSRNHPGEGSHQQPGHDGGRTHLDHGDRHRDRRGVQPRDGGCGQRTQHHADDRSHDTDDQPVGDIVASHRLARETVGPQHSDLPSLLGDHATQHHGQTQPGGHQEHQWEGHGHFAEAIEVFGQGGLGGLLGERLSGDRSQAHRQVVEALVGIGGRVVGVDEHRLVLYLGRWQGGNDGFGGEENAPLIERHDGFLSTTRRPQILRGRHNAGNGEALPAGGGGDVDGVTRNQVTGTGEVLLDQHLIPALRVEVAAVQHHDLVHRGLAVGRHSDDPGQLAMPADPHRRFAD